MELSGKGVGIRARGTRAGIVFAMALLFCVATAADAAVEMPGIFSDHMVLQCDMPVPVWGKAVPGEKVKVSFRGQFKETTAEADGRWMLKLDAMKALPGQKADVLTVEGENRIEFKDVLVGEVWFGSGQSNMVWPIYSCKDADKEDAAANEPMIRFSCNNLWPSYETPGGGWCVCEPGRIRKFSALMYYFGRELQHELGVPVGLICRAVSGSAACPWISTNGFMSYPPLVEEYKAYSEKEYPALKAEYDAKLKEWEKQCAKANEALASRIQRLDSTNFEAQVTIAKAAPAPDPETGEIVWRPGSMRLKYDGKGGWTMGGISINNRYGMTVGRCAGVVTQSQDGIAIAAEAEFKQGANFGPGQVRYNAQGGIDDNQRGVTNFEPRQVRYNILVSRKGGEFVGKAEIVMGDSRFESEVKGAVTPLPGEAAPGKPGGPPPGDYPQPPACGEWHWRFMVTNNLPYAIRGVLWDQGESGTGYRGLKLATVTAGIAESWRKERGINFPFLFVQKPSGGGWQWNTNLVDKAGKPVPRPVLPATPAAAFATNRLPGAYTFLDMMAIPNSRMCIAMDLDAGLHPFNKHDYGRRLARIALSETYGRKWVYYGPIYKSHSVETVEAGKAIRVVFDYVGGGLEARGGDPLQGFSIAGPDRQFVWADARIERDTVVVWSDKVTDPKAVRYAWADAPSWANLFNKDGFPALIFRTDDW